jgi:hypothetical protein
MGQDEGPSERLLLWTVYMFPVVAGAVALILLRAGQVVGETGGSVLLGQGRLLDEDTEETVAPGPGAANLFSRLSTVAELPRHLNKRQLRTAGRTATGTRNRWHGGP